MKWLAPIALLYAAMVRFRAWLYQRGLCTSHRLPGLVISIGNLEVGGTGKSPVVMAVAQFLLSAGARPVILTRGYRSGLKSDESAAYQGTHLILTPQTSPHFQADEARMQANKLAHVPVIIGADRWAAAQRYLNSHEPPTHWILDDGFQHLRLKRDLDIVLLDALRPLDNGWCLPAGRLREPVSALKRATLLVLTRSPRLSTSEIHPSLLSLNKPIYCAHFREGAPEQVMGPSTNLSEVQHWGLALGIARPERVRQALQQQGIHPHRELIVPDHQGFPLSELSLLARDCEAILTTEKDYWRNPDIFATISRPIFVLPLHVEWGETFSLSNLFSSFTRS